MAIKIGGTFKVVVRKDGRTVVEKDHKAAEAKLPVNLRLQRKKSKRVRVLGKNRTA